MKRFTIVNLMMLVGVVALGMAAMRDGSEWAWRGAFSAMLAALAVALLGAIILRGSAPWVGFALFGGGYAGSAFLPVLRDEIQPLLITTPLLDRIVDRSFDVPPAPVTPAFMIQGYSPDADTPPLTPEAEASAVEDYVAKCSAHSSRVKRVERQLASARQVSHSILALTLGILGATLGRFLAWRHTSRGLSSGREFSTETSPLTS